MCRRRSWFTCVDRGGRGMVWGNTWQSSWVHRSHRIESSRAPELLGALRRRVGGHPPQQQLLLLPAMDLPSPGRIVFAGLFSAGSLAILSDAEGVDSGVVRQGAEQR